MRTPLKVGVLLDSFIQPAWVEKVIETIQESEFARISLVALNHSVPVSRRLMTKFWRNRRYFVYKCYSRMDDIFFRPKPDAFARINVQKRLQDCVILNVTPALKKFSDYFPDDAIAEIRKLDLDVLLRFGFRILRGEILKVPKYGVWSYHHGDNLVNRGGPPGFWEVMKGETVTGSVLQILTEDLDAGKVIYRSFARTNRRSVKRNKNNYYWKSSEFVIRKLRDLYHDGIESLNQEVPFAEQPYSSPLYKKPSNVESLGLVARLLTFNFADKLKDVINAKQWFLAYQFQPNLNLSASLFQFHEIVPPKDRYWADPFPIKHQDHFYVFIEEYLYHLKKGHISVFELRSNGEFTNPVKVLEEKHHLSYPFIFEWEGSYYLIPETGGSKSVELYRCKEFPWKWEHVNTLIAGSRAVDVTIQQIEERWWMFANIAVDGASTFDELHLFHAENPFGPWKPHRKNPVKSDCRSARPAGNLFRMGDAWIRPAQDCSIRYGYAISLNQIMRMDLDHYQEIEVSKIYPKWKKKLLATHTLNSIQGLTIIDAMASRRKLL